ncbi:MAG: 50S ribosomal protein L23 [Pseudomonadota bacterium]
MNQERLMQILVTPHISEKSAVAAEMSGQHTFKVVVDANKLEVKHAVEKLFSVKVQSVRMINMKGKNKRFGQRLGRRVNWKKAIVRLEDGHDIDFVGGGS